MSDEHAPSVAGELNGPPSMSMDGRHIAWLSSGDAAPRLVLFDVVRRRELGRIDAAPARVRAFTWSHLPGVGIAVADGNGSENWMLYLLQVKTAEWTAVADSSAEQMRVAGLSAQRPAEVLVATNRRDPRHHDYEVVSLHTGERTHMLENTGYSAVYFDAGFQPRLVETVNPDGSRVFWHGEPARGHRFLRVPHEAALCARFTHFSTDGHIAYFVLPDGSTGTRLVGLRCVDNQPATEVETVFTVRRADIGRILESALTARPEYLEVDRFRRRTIALHPSLEPPLRLLWQRLGAEPLLLERRLGDRYWLVAEYRAGADVRYFVYQPDVDQLWPLSVARPRQHRLPIFCRIADVPLRGGGRAVTYLAGPHSGWLGDGGTAKDTCPPAVLLVHGGPWRRSRWEYNERRAWLANQGLTVIEPNFRGSTGFGADWVNAADRQWGAAMQDDLEDALDWAIRRGHADPDRIGLVGGSYGGYAVLQLATTSVRRFSCVVATSPLTDLVAFIEELPEPWRTAAPMVRRRIGDPADPEQRRALVQKSPLTNASTVCCPVLLVHGVNDTRVPVEMSARMFMALACGGKDATLALFPDEGHEIVNASNRRAADELIAGFLARHLRGAATPYPSPPAATMNILRTPRSGVVAEQAKAAVTC